jgi:hypothetical protein
LNYTDNFGSPVVSGKGRHGQDDSAASGSVSINGYGDVSISGSEVAGRDINKTTTNTTINKHRHLQLGLGAVAIAVLTSVGAIGYHVATSSSSGGIVYTPGVSGAVGTIQQMQQAEESGDASAWCFLASSSDSSTCQDLLSNGYSSPHSPSIRTQVADVTIGEPTGSGETYTFNLTYQGHSYPGVSFEWTGQRWQLSSVIYLAALNNGGLFASVVETGTGTGAILGIPF